MLLRLFFLLVFCSFSLIPIVTKAQNQKTHYLFPEYSVATIKYKSGANKKIPLNFNMLTEEMVFDRNGEKLALINASQIDTIYIGQKKFVPERENFLEVNAEARIPFYIAHKLTLIPPKGNDGYGGTTETSATQSLSQIVEGGKIYNLTLTGDYQFLPASTFWLKKGNQVYKIANVKDLMAFLPDKTAQIKSLSKSQKTNFQKQEDLVKLLKQL